MDNTGHTFSAGHPWRSAPAAEAVFDRTVEFLAGALSAWR
jgi:hypothetical protein